MAATIESILNDFKTNNQKTMDALKRELGQVRAGKATPALLESVRVSYYGNLSPLNQIATVSTPDPRTLVIAPWDTTALPEIEKAINQSNLGLTPQNDGKIIRLNIPALTEERRKELVKHISKMSEESKVAVRQHRKTANEGMKALEKDKKLSEDDSKKQLDVIQKLTDEATKVIDDLVAKKNSEVMTI